MAHQSYMTFRLARNIAGTLDRLSPTKAKHLALLDQYTAEVSLKESKAAELFNRRTDDDAVNDLYRSLMKLYDNVHRLRKDIAAERTKH